MSDQPIHTAAGIEIMYEGDDSWSEWVHRQPGYVLQCCDCNLVHEMEFALVPAEEVEGLTPALMNEGETDEKVIIFRASRV